jgi:hypothetical protein
VPHYFSPVTLLATVLHIFQCRTKIFIFLHK